MFDLLIREDVAGVPVPLPGRAMVFAGVGGGLKLRLSDGTVKNVEGVQGAPGATGATGAKGDAGAPGAAIVASMQVGAYMLISGGAVQSGEVVTINDIDWSFVTFAASGALVKSGTVVLGRYRNMGPAVVAGGAGLFLRIE